MERNLFIAKVQAVSADNAKYIWACENKSDLSVTFGDFELKVLSGR